MNERWYMLMQAFNMNHKISISFAEEKNGKSRNIVKKILEKIEFSALNKAKAKKRGSYEVGKTADERWGNKNRWSKILEKVEHSILNKAQTNKEGSQQVGETSGSSTKESRGQGESHVSQTPQQVA